MRHYAPEAGQDAGSEDFPVLLGNASLARAEWWNGEGKFQKKNAALISHEGKFYYFVLAKEGKPVVFREKGDTRLLTVKKMGMVGQNLPKFLFSFGVNPWFEEHPESEECVLSLRMLHPVRISREIYEIKKAGSFTKKKELPEEERLRNLHLIIDAYRAFMSEFTEFQQYDFSKLRNTEDYGDFGEFIADVETHTVSMEWREVSWKEIERLVHEGAAYLFLIHNRFLYSRKPGRNTYTRLFLALLSDANLMHTTLLPNTNPQITYRPGKPEGKSSREKESFFLKLTLTVNADVSERYRDSLNDRIREEAIDYVVSISRSTEDLLYVLVMDEKGNIPEERSLNVINGTDYREILFDDRRRNGKGKSARTPKELFHAYVRLAVSEVIHLACQYRAMIVIEDAKEKDSFQLLSVEDYRYFRRFLCRRLECLSFPDIPEGEPGSISNPLQLTDPKGSRYQNGIVSFVGDLYTKNIDPETGFADIFLRTPERRELLARMDHILFEEDRIRLSFDYANFETRYHPSRTRWSVEISGCAVYYDKYHQEERYLSDVVKDLIAPSAAFELSGDLVDRIRTAPKSFINALWRAFFGTLHGNIRSTAGHDGAYISPVSKKKYEIGAVNAGNLARKFYFRRTYRGTSDQFTTSWLDYLQARN